MLKLTRLNGKPILVNSRQIEYVDQIPETKVVMMNQEYLLVKETIEQIIEEEIKFRQRCKEVDVIRKDEYENN